MIPTTLADWTLDSIRALLDAKVPEDDQFDWKASLQEAKSASKADRLDRCCAAFANASGGFLIFGIKDDRILSTDDRIIGIDGGVDFWNQFGDYPARCDPSVQWEPRQPPIQLPNGRLIYVVWIPESRRKPHSCSDDGRRWFVKRTGKGNESMSHDEIRIAFEGAEFRRTKLSLLVSELEMIGSIAAEFRAPVDRDSQFYDRLRNSAWLTRYPTGVVDSVLGDAMSLIGPDDQLVRDLFEIRDAVRRSNILAEQLALTVAVRSWGSTEDHVRVDWQKDMASKAQWIVELCGSARQRIAEWLLSGRGSP